MPFGIIFGTLASAAGVSFAGTMGMSMFVFAGSAQFISISLVAAGTAWPMIVVTTFVVNLRHMLYGATMVPYYKNLSRPWQMLLAFGLTDESFAVAIDRYRQRDGAPNKHYYNLGSMVFMYTNWNLCTFVGLTAGSSFPEITQWGLDFAMPATFIGMVIPYLVSRPMWASVITAGIISVAAAGLPHKLGLMAAAIAGVGTGLALEIISKGENMDYKKMDTAVNGIKADMEQKNMGTAVHGIKADMEQKNIDTAVNGIKADTKPKNICTAVHEKGDVAR
ncbi:MAG: AzlC family ABC transporter permease [Desulfamplus sp.]|nr:AzlC family ABC transporter permease [Desulfamplus sp.]